MGQDIVEIMTENMNQRVLCEVNILRNPILIVNMLILVVHRVLPT